jgi:hypothetical protein
MASMKKPDEKIATLLVKLLRKRILWILFGLALLWTLLLIAMPWGIEYGLKRYLLNQGVDQAGVENVDFNPFTGRLVVKNLVVKVGNEKFLNVAEAGFIFSWSPFFKKRLVLEKVDFTNSTMTMEELPDGRWRIGGLLPSPSANKSSASSWGFGLAELQIQNSQVKLRSSKVAGELKIKQARLTRLRSWRPDQSAHLEFKGQLNDGNLQFQGDFSPFGEDKIIDGTIKLQELTLKPFARVIAADPAGLQGRLDADVRIRGINDSEKGFSFDQKGRIVVQGIRSQFGSVTLADKDLTWNGTVQVKMPKASDAIRIAASGRLEGKEGSVNPAPENLMFRHSGLKWNGKLSLAHNPETSDFKLDGVLKLQELKMITSDVSLSDKSLTWNGSLEFLMTENIEKNKLTTNGKLECEDQVVTFYREKLKFDHGRLLWDGQFDFGLKNFAAGLAAQGDFSLSDLAVTDTQRKLRLLASKAVNLKSIKADADKQFSIAEANITGLDLIGETGSPEEASLISASEVTFDTVKLELFKRVSIESARIVAAKGMLQHKSDGRWLYIDDLTTLPGDYGSSSQKKRLQNETAAKTQPPAKKKDVEFGIRIGSLEIVGDSGLHFEDETVSPVFSTDVVLKEARLTNVDSFKPEQSSPFTLEASSRKYTRIKLEGDVQPFRERISMDLKGKIRAAELPPLSPYAVKTLGYNLISGEMDADIDLKIIMGKMQGEGDLKLYNPKIEAVDPEKFKNGAGKSIPLQSALEVLRDKDGDVRLKIPISGNVTDPKFSFSDAIDQALFKGLSIATLSYLKYMLGPYGMAVGIIELAVKVGTKALPGIRLKPVEFRPGATDLDPDTMEYIDKVAAILKEKKDLRLRLCGWATESDRMGRFDSEPLETKSAPAGQIDAQKEPRLPLSDEPLLQLAEQRADLIKDILVSRHGIKEKRIFICKPEIDKNPDAKSRVELVF